MMTKSNPPKHVILYADDDADDLLLVQEALTNFTDSVEVITMNSGEEAIDFLENLDALEPAPCLIILDVNMPRLNGKETLLKIRNMERFEEIPVVLFTTSTFPLDKSFAEKYKAGFITKPIDMRQMGKIADQFVEHCTDEIKKNIQKKVR